MKRFTAMAITAFVPLTLMMSSNTIAQSPVMQVYKSETCGCCDDWVDHIENAGIEVKTTNLDQMQHKKMELGIPGNLASCHTAVIDGYLIEGHVPASDIMRLLKESPKITGLTVPGMPHGSPGMETGRVDQYQVLAFDNDQQTISVWEEYPQN